MTTLTLEAHDSDIFCTTQIPVDYDRKADCPEFRAFLGDIFSEDQEIIALMQETFGYVLSSSTAAQKFFVWIGDGSNAKGVIAKILTSLMGEENVSRVSLNRISERFGLASIVDKRLILATENEKNPRGLNTEMLKAITAGETVNIERKYESEFEYTPQLKAIFSCNRPPKFNDWSFAIKRRMIMVPFERCYVEDEPIFDHEGKINLHIADELLAELPGILAWSLQGWGRLRDNDLRFTKSKKVEDYLMEYWLEHDPFKDFVRTCVSSVPGGKIRQKELYQCVCNFFSDNGLKNYASTLTPRTMCREFEATLRSERIFYTRKKSDGGRPFYEVTLNNVGKEYLTCKVDE